MSLGHLGRRVTAVLLLCAASTGAVAWQRPKPQDPAKTDSCPGMGEGYVRLPGSDTCIRVGGSVRVEALHAGGAPSYYPAGR